jgi:hypothetical protein
MSFINSNSKETTTINFFRGLLPQKNEYKIIFWVKLHSFFGKSVPYIEVFKKSINRPS